MSKEIFFGKKKFSSEEDEQKEDKWYDIKSGLMDYILGKEHNMVMHSLKPFDDGGDLHLYYYPNGIEGTGIATKDLALVTRKSPSNDVYDFYEFVMFTRESLDLKNAKNEETAFGKAHKKINRILNAVSRYSFENKLNPKETLGFPDDPEMGIFAGKCLIFCDYKEDGQMFGVMLIMEIFRSEMEYAIQNGGANLIEKLKERGYYPYSDMDRDPVV